MTDRPIKLDQHRGMAAQKATEIRRLLAEVEDNEKALRQRQEELETQLLAIPAASWSEAAEKARYLLGIFAVDVDRARPAPTKVDCQRARRLRASVSGRRRGEARIGNVPPGTSNTKALADYAPVREGPSCRDARGRIWHERAVTGLIRRNISGFPDGTTAVSTVLVADRSRRIWQVPARSEPPSSLQAIGGLLRARQIGNCALQFSTPQQGRDAISTRLACECTA